jgi:hypothetical protein
VIEEHAPCVETDAEAIDARLLERVLAEEAEKLEHGKVGVVLNALEVGGDKPVEKVTAFGKKPAHKEIQNMPIM